MEIIELGGRENRNTYRDSLMTEESRRSNLSPDGANRKIIILEGRIK
jgi:hypothetical protein